MNWGYRILLSFVVFMGIIITLVVISMKQDVGLVSADYYKQEIAYQDQIDRIDRTMALETQPVIEVRREVGTLEVSLPQENIEAGEVWLYRASDESQDRKYQVPSEGRIDIPTGELIKGRWQVKLQWTHDGLEYYKEASIYL